MKRCQIHNSTLVLIFTLFISCSSFQCDEQEIDLFNALCEKNSRINCNAFVFFTDPHINDVNSNLFTEYIKPIYEYYTSLDLDFCICGGDWLNNSDTQDEAKNKLMDINNFLSDYWQNNYYPVLGNHDTNYQGILNHGSAEWSGELPYNTLVKLLFNKFGQTYYDFSSKGTIFFVLDSGLDINHNMDNHRWEQIHWLAKKLLSITEQHVVLIMHIYTHNSTYPELFAKHVMQLSEAYNNSSQIILNDILYDFSNSKGKIGCILCGHCHSDFIIETNSIPVIGTTHLKDNDMPSFDLCLINWDLNQIYMQRIGTGSNRVVNLAN